VRGRTPASSTFPFTTEPGRPGATAGAAGPRQDGAGIKLTIRVILTKMATMEAI